MYVHAVLCLALRDQENLAKSTWNLFGHEENIFNRAGIREYGGRMRREMNQEEMIKTMVRVCKCPSSKGFPQFKLGCLTF